MTTALFPAGTSSTMLRPGVDVAHAKTWPAMVVGYRRQRTLAKPVSLTGRGLLYGHRVSVRLLPAAPNTGRIFVRVDRKPPVVLSATAENVTLTERRTVLGQPPDHVEVVEHILAALAGMMVDNCRIELDGLEPPGWDGSVRELVSCLQEAGLSEQEALTPILTAPQALEVRQTGSRIAFLPSSGPHLELDYFLDYGVWSPLPPQRFSCRLTPEDFLNHLAASRTFLLLEEVQAMRQRGVGMHTGPEQVLVFSQQGLLANRLRWADEPARHKTLDLLGDLSLVGWPLAGRVVAYRTGHTLNVALARQVRSALLAAGLNATLHAA